MALRKPVISNRQIRTLYMHVGTVQVSWSAIGDYDAEKAYFESRPNAMLIGKPQFTTILTAQRAAFSKSCLKATGRALFTS